MTPPAATFEAFLELRAALVALVDTAWLALADRAVPELELALMHVGYVRGLPPDMASWETRRHFAHGGSR